MGSREHSDITSGYIELWTFLNLLGRTVGNVTVHNSLL